MVSEIQLLSIAIVKRTSLQVLLVNCLLEVPFSYKVEDNSMLRSNQNFNAIDKRPPNTIVISLTFTLLISSCVNMLFWCTTVHSERA